MAEQYRFEVGKIYRHRFPRCRRYAEFVCVDRIEDTIWLVEVGGKHRTFSGDIGRAQVGTDGYNEVLAIGEIDQGDYVLIEYIAARDFTLGVARMSADFIVGRYYVLETSVLDGLIWFLREARRDGVITDDDLMRLQSAKCVKRTRCMVTFRIPMLGCDVRVRTKRADIETEGNEVARIPRMTLDCGIYKGRTTYPPMTIYAYDSLGNNDRMNDEMQGVYRWLNAAWSCATPAAGSSSAATRRPGMRNPGPGTSSKRQRESCTTPTSAGSTSRWTWTRPRT